jgi:predicted nucleotidyltransferase component of viral defense system
MIPRKQLEQDAASVSFRPEMVEKALTALSLLEAFVAHPYLRERFAVKGGTAINLFYFPLPRLSVDLELNYLGSGNEKETDGERTQMIAALRAACQKTGLLLYEPRKEHNCWTWETSYRSPLVGQGGLSINLHFLFRRPLWPILLHSSQPFACRGVVSAPVTDLHELAAEKIVALFCRKVSVDLFDAHTLLEQKGLDQQRLRLGFVLFGAMNERDWRTIKVQDVSFRSEEFRTRLVPLLRKETLQDTKIETYSDRITEECRSSLAAVLPLQEQEHEFLDRLLDYGELRGELLTQDAAMVERINRHPGLTWKGETVHKRLNPPVVIPKS